MTDEPGIDPPTTEPADAHVRAAAGTAVLDVELDSQRQRIDELAKNLDAYRISRDTWTIAVFVVSFLVLIGSMVAVGLAMRNNDDGSASAGQTITADLSEYAIALVVIAGDAGEQDRRHQQGHDDPHARGQGHRPDHRSDRRRRHATPWTCRRCRPATTRCSATSPATRDRA